MDKGQYEVEKKSKKSPKNKVNQQLKSKKWGRMEEVTFGSLESN